MKAPNDLKQARRRELYRIAAAHCDVSSAHEICQHYMAVVKNWNSHLQGKHVPHELNYAMMSSIVTAYARPFSGGNIGQIPSRCFKFTDPSMKAFHEDTISMRNSVYAHTDAGPSLTLYPVDHSLPFSDKPHKNAWQFVRKEFSPEALGKLFLLTGWMQARLQDEVLLLIDEITVGRKLEDGPMEITREG